MRFFDFLFGHRSSEEIYRAYDPEHTQFLPHGLDDATCRFDDASTTPMGTVLYGHAPHVLLTFLLDVSGSMRGRSIELLNQAMNKLHPAIVKQCPEIMAQLEVAVVAYNGRIVTEYTKGFVPIMQFKPRRMNANGNTCDAEARIYANEMIENRIKYLRENDCSVYRPIIVCITDGLSHSNDQITSQAVASTRVMKQKYGLKLWQFSTLPKDDRNYQRQINHLRRYSDDVLAADSDFYNDIIDFTAKSMKTISNYAGVADDDEDEFKTILFGRGHH